MNRLKTVFLGLSLGLAFTPVNAGAEMIAPTASPTSTTTSGPKLTYEEQKNALIGQPVAGVVSPSPSTAPLTTTVTSTSSGSSTPYPSTIYPSPGIGAPPYKALLFRKNIFTWWGGMLGAPTYTESEASVIDANYRAVVKPKSITNYIVDGIFYNGQYLYEDQLSDDDIQMIRSNGNYKELNVIDLRQIASMLCNDLLSYQIQYPSYPLGFIQPSFEAQGFPYVVNQYNAFVDYYQNWVLGNARASSLGCVFPRPLSASGN